MNFKLIMPMAGNGTRFADAGYQDPKPLINVRGKPMFVQAVENIGLEFDEKIFIVQKSHNIKQRVLDYYPDAHVVEIDGVTDGAARSVLLADPYVSNEDAVFISNCDQLIDWDAVDFKNKMNNNGIILTFECPDRNPKWSFAKTNATGRVTQVAEKNPISDIATTGHYYWSHWITFKNSAHEMILNNDRFNNEFYLCPVFNYTIAAGGSVVTSNVAKMHGLGTPEDLQAWLDL